MGKHRAPKTAQRSRRMFVVATVAAFALIGGTVLAVDAGTVDVQVGDKTGYKNGLTNEGAIVEYIGDSNTTFGSAGSGTFQAFLRTHESPSEAGYNSDLKKKDFEFDEVAGSFTKSILVSEIPIVECESVDGNLLVEGQCWELFADVNDSNSTPLIQLTDLEVWFSDVASPTGYPFAPPLELIYDFEGNVLINDVNQGSGRGDLRYLVPLVGIDLPENCEYGNSSCETFFVLFTGWGDNEGGDYTTDAGFNEWKVKRYPFLTVEKDATTTYTRTFGWTITKSASPDHDLFVGDSDSSDYLVTATKDAGVDTDWAVSGSITVSNPSDEDAVLESITDSISGVGDLTVDCGVTVDGYLLEPGDSLVCTYSSNLPDGTARTNTATATLDTSQVFQGQADVAFGDPTTLVNDEVVVTDDFDGGGEVSLGTVSSTTTFPYNQTFDCSDVTFASGADTSDTVTYNNTARVKAGTTVLASASAAVDVTCYKPTIEKDADTAYTVTYGWTITKSASPDHDLFVGDSDSSGYSVTATKDSGTESAWAVSGDITIGNPHPSDALVITDLSDSLTGTDATAVTITGCTGTDVTYVGGTLTVLSGGGPAVCSYTASPTGTDVTLNTASFTLFSLPYSAEADVAFGDPTTLVNDEVVVTDDFDGGGEVSLGTVSSTTTFPYNQTFDCSDVTFASGADTSDTVTYNNTARVKAGTTVLASASAAVDVTCYKPTIEKDADTAYTVTYGWTITKSASPDHDLFVGDSDSSGYSVTATKDSGTESAWAVSGDITIGNPHPSDALVITDLSDSLTGTDATAVTITGCTGTDVTYVGGTLTVLSGGGPAVCSYTASPTGTDVTLNTASFTLFSLPYSAEADVAFGDPTTLVNDEVVVTDDFDGGGEVSLGTVSSTTTFPYNQTFDCSDVTFASGADTSDTVTYNNTARVKAGTTVLASASAAVDVTCYKPTIEKDADTSLDRTWTWQIVKSADQTEITLLPGNIVTVNYSIRLDATSTDSNFDVSGDITIGNPHPSDALVITDLSDSLTGTDATAVTITGCTGTDVTYVGGTLTVLSGGGPAVCSYTASPTGTDVTLNTASFTLFSLPYSAEATVDWSTATIEYIDETIDVTDDLGTLDMSDDLSWAVTAVDPSPFSTTLTYSREFTAATFPECGDHNVINTARFVAQDTLASGASSWTVLFHIPCDEGCTPGFWQGGDGAPLWNDLSDPDWTLPGGNPFDHETLFNSYFTSWDSLDGLTMWDLASTGGGSDPARKAARSLVAAYLNSSHDGVNYPYGTTELDQLWTEAATGVDGPDDGDDVMTFMALHLMLDEANNAPDCPIDSNPPDIPVVGGAVIALLTSGSFWYRGRHRK